MEKGTKKSAHVKPPHHQMPSQESGYTDLAAEECHDLIDQAEEDAHLHDPNSMYSTTDKPEPVHRLQQKGGLEGTSTSISSGATGAKEKMQQTGEKISSTVGEKMGEMKKKMGMEK
ncbi:hypothetical protein VTI74DRAFT_1675 [Chaetomium olivicolor]